MVKGMRNLFQANMAAWLRAVADHARSSEAILFCGLMYGPGLILSEEFRKPAVFLSLQPVWQTREFSSPAMRPMRLPGWLNRWTHALPYRQLWSLCARGAYGTP